MEKEKEVIGLLVILLVIAGLVFYVKNKEYHKGPALPKVATSTMTVGEIVGSKTSDSLGTYLTDNKGMTLYAFSDDTRLRSTCFGECAKTWHSYYYFGKNPSANSDPLSKKMNVFEKAKGAYQYAYGTKPVYTFEGDKKPGDTNGKGLDSGKWSIILIK